ncbi:putative chromosome-partitioning protein ParB [Nitrospira japonica]|uniref:Putative chromosome-partitioning protein ParB n=1 Tax=Nitrospira japonica TaxID=1325564 RepID=A0A1W1I3N9_9BACT|nr:ParB/RepB/Spo0J family partition protein [Nitrospira japonica]SLM47585.1 putative chromosome-partitioning protein ParB [Nitrospira japonica]
MEKKALGRGLEALLPSNKPVSVPDAADLQHLRVDAIVPNRYQPRQTFSPEELDELAASLKQSGLLQPILVRRKGDGMYELISGERRWRASKAAGLETIQAVVRNCSDEESMVLALVENLQREDLNPLEMAKAYHRMVVEFGLTQEVIAQRVGCERSSIANIVRLLNLPQEVQQLIETDQLSLGHAKVILGLSSPAEQQRIAQLIAARGLSVRETEKLVESALGEKKRKIKEVRRSPLSDVEHRLEKRLGTKVTIANGKRGGKIVIHYFSPAELDGILENILQ